MNKIYFTFIVACLFSINANAQFLKKIGDRAKEAAERTLERKAEEKTEQTIGSTVDTIFDAPKKMKKKNNKKRKEISNESSPDHSEDSMNDIMESVFGGNNPMTGMGNASFENSYIFPVTATIEVEDATANLQKTTMKQGYGNEALITEMEVNGDPIIIDMKNQSAIMLNINQGTAQVMSLEWMQKILGNNSITDEEANDMVPNVSKTGKTKMMNGYQCHEYNITFEEGKINAWYAPDVKFEYQDYLRGMAKMFSKKKEENPMQLLNTEYGYVMEMTFYNKQNKKQNSMKVIELDEKVRMINMSLYNIQKL